MDWWSDLLKAGMGGLAGFMLAQIVQAGKWFIDWCQRPYLVIEDHNDCLILSHSDEQANGERYEEKRYGFYVRNRGRSIATGVQFQLIKIEHKPDPTAGFSTVSEHTWHLATYNKAEKNGASRLVLVKNGSALVALAGWREDRDVVYPTISNLGDYYEESCDGSTEFRFTVVAFADNAKMVDHAFTIRNPTGRTKPAERLEF